MFILYEFDVISEWKGIYNNKYTHVDYKNAFLS